MHILGESDDRERGDLMGPASLPSRLPAGDPLHGGVEDPFELALALVLAVAHFPAGDLLHADFLLLVLVLDLLVLGDPQHGGVVDILVLALTLVVVVADFPVVDLLHGGLADFLLLVLDILVLGDPLRGGEVDLLVLAGALQAGGLQR